MRDAYTQIINNFITSMKNKKNDIINPDSVDALINTLTDFYIFILENGLINFKNNIEFNYKTTKKIFIAGINLLKEAIPFDKMDFALEFLLLNLIKEKKITTQELYEAYLLIKIMPTLQPDKDCIKKYIDFIISFSSNKEQHVQIIKFIKIAEIYKIKDCFSLNQIINNNSCQNLQDINKINDVFYPIEWQAHMNNGKMPVNNK